jgi:putative sigma-54 modulation protein
MDITIKSRSAKANEEERAYLQRKLQKLDRYLDEIGTIHVDLERSQLRGIGEVYISQATLVAEHGVIIRAEERDADFFAAVDALHDTLQRQLTRYKERRYGRGKARRTNGVLPDMSLAGEDGTTDARENSRPRLVKTKQFVYKPMDSDEAIEQMELLGHDFFVFTDAQTNVVNVVYRRNDGQYGLIEQEVA